MIYSLCDLGPNVLKGNMYGGGQVSSLSFLSTCLSIIPSLLEQLSMIIVDIFLSMFQSNKKSNNISERVSFV